MPNLTTNHEFNKPLVNNATDADLWGGYLNDNWDAIDSLLNQTTSSKSASFSVAVTEFNCTYLIDASGGTVTAALPAVANVWAGFVVRFKAIDISNTITIDGSGSETIDGSETVTINAENDVLELTCDGTGWQITTSTTSFADDAEVIAGTEPNKAIAPKFYGDNQTLASEGTRSLPGGLIEKWGVETGLTNTGSASISFAEAFPNNLYNVQISISYASPIGSNANSVAVIDKGTLSASGFSIFIDNISGGPNDYDVYWRAIGD